ncbi:zinc/manganese transport system ATP-binding protein [Microlunatus sagamiharensis]|uniref:Zinc/manganese transport system ATP-binding protein n=1 Tax=Microlunatus sagamiharensis TaxID=546874 RepID=A0A1H2MBD3_9ACTN|nr:zinc/manganese transport system ATP-binding protein [Microlunatus sagamiharensis]
MVLRGVRVDFGAHHALRGVDLELSAGRVTAVAGPNGAGKTTLLEVVAGTRRPSAGTRSAPRTVAFVPQRAAVPDRLPVTVRDVVTVGTWRRPEVRRRQGTGRRAAVDEALERLDLTGVADRPFAVLSGGQRQRALLAQGLVGRADLLLLDEPTTGLDAASSARIRALVANEARRGAAVLCVSHDPALLETADRVVHLEDGRVVTGARVPTQSGRRTAHSNPT